MRKLLFAALAAGLFLVPVPAAPAQEPAAILEKAVKAHGGKEREAKVKAQQSKAKGKLEVMGLSLELTQESAVQYPDKLKEVLHFDVMGQKITQTVVYNGKEGWINTNGTTMDMPEALLEQMKEATYMMRVGRLMFVGDKDYQLASLGETKVNDQPAVGVKVSHKGHKDANLYFDKETGLLAKIEYRSKDFMTMQEVDEERVVSDYKDVDGLKVPHKVVVLRDGKKFMEAEVTEIKFLDKLDDSEFAKP